jgi:Zn-dependent protease with chaperone function
MVKFTPRPLTDNVNVSKVSLPREFLVLFAGLMGLLIVGYAALGVTLNILIDKMPSRLEAAAGTLFNFKEFIAVEKYAAIQQEAQHLLDDLTALLPVPSSVYTVHIVDKEDINAIAMPRGHILLFSGLLKEVKSQNELAMVLAHELGHYARRDHLRALGRGVVLMAAAAALFGTDSSVMNVVAGALSTVEMKFSREQEEAADRFALELLRKKYGHVAGATDFFQRLEKEKGLSKFLVFFSTHPLDTRRVGLLNQAAGDLSYPMGDKTPLSPAFEELLEEGKEKNL